MNKILEAIPRCPGLSLGRHNDSFTCLDRIREQFPSGGKGFQCFIEQNTSSEKEAIDLFFALLEEYDQKQPGK
ncbi:MAG TPA: hypothetical protein VGV18_10615 [Verrucomicrobiae bacterium]|nr:hypothetical protein [Verrucomicrobiae bacterium]